MKLVVGLGNPGKTYRNTRHNIGFRVVTKIAEEYKVRFKRSYLLKSYIAHTKIGREAVTLAMPLTFMNLSGGAVAKIIKRKKIEPKDILVICDDINTVFGNIKIRPSGTDGGHQGLRSITEVLSGDNFARLKVGASRPGRKEDVVNYVLSDFNKEEKILLPEIIEKAVSCCQAWLEDGIEKAMNQFN